MFDITVNLTEFDKLVNHNLHSNMSFAIMWAGKQTEISNFDPQNQTNVSP